MIANPTVPAFRYDPYEKRLTIEKYSHSEMRRLRSAAIDAGRKSLSSGTAQPESNWGVVLGTLGRQGSMSVLRVRHPFPKAMHPVADDRGAQSVTDYLPSNSHVPILLSELSPSKLELLAAHISIFVQTSCPRLSIDWGYAFPRPLLSPYEASIALGRTRGWMEEEENVYRMDFYADESSGDWTPRFKVGLKRQDIRRRQEERAREREAAAT
jgi:2-(3-amino-3-carboxypropyl)histidine synthase